VRNGGRFLWPIFDEENENRPMSIIGFPGENRVRWPIWPILAPYPPCCDEVFLLARTPTQQPQVSRPGANPCAGNRPNGPNRPTVRFFSGNIGVLIGRFRKSGSRIGRGNRPNVVYRLRSSRGQAALRGALPDSPGEAQGCVGGKIVAAGIVWAYNQRGKSKPMPEEAITWERPGKRCSPRQNGKFPSRPAG